MIPQVPTPEWAIECFDRVVRCDDPEIIDALLELLAGIAPDGDWDHADENKPYKYDAAWAAIQYGFRKTIHCEEACREHLRANGLEDHRSSRLAS